MYLGKILNVEFDIDEDSTPMCLYVSLENGHCHIISNKDIDNLITILLKAKEKINE